MTRKTRLFLCFTLLVLRVAAQAPSSFPCADRAFAGWLTQQSPNISRASQSVETAIASWRKKVSTGFAHPLGAGPLVLPVVVHIIHNNGPEDISDIQVRTAIQHLNEAYANTGYYDPSDGVTTNIQFCLAQRDPDNQPTNGITRDVSSYTVMDQTNPFADDLHVKNIRRWNPFCYINIWVVASISPVYAGYATHPESHGNISDGIVVTARLFGTSYPNDVVITHEMGHYLGLYHTFEGGCTNTDCSIDGDKVCDTPPSQSTADISCGQTINTCQTDVLSGFTTDQNDLKKDYMDYGNYSCMTVFTQGQADRMNAAIQTARSSLLACKSCMAPCPSPVTAGFTLPANTNEAGTTYTITNTSVGAVSYSWYVNGALVSAATDLSYTFPAVGSYTIRLVASSGDTLCVDGEKTGFVYIPCPAGGCPVVAPPPVTDTCVVNTFQKKFGGTKVDNLHDVVVDADGNYLVTGLTTSFGAGTTNMQVVKFDPAGRVVWAEAIGDAGQRSIGNCAAVLSDGTSLHVGQAETYGFGVTHLDKQGNLLWARHYMSTVGSVDAYSIQATQDGGAVVAPIYADGQLNEPNALIKLDGSGNVQWSKLYFNYNQPYPKWVLEDGGQLVTVAEISPLFGTQTEFLIYAVDEVTGALQWGKVYSIAGGTGMHVGKILNMGDRWMIALKYTSGINIHWGFVYTDKSGVPLTASTLDAAIGADNGWVDEVVRQNGNICVFYGPLNAGDPVNAGVAELTPDGRLVRAHRFASPDGETVVRLQITPDDGLVGAGSAYIGARAVGGYILKTDSNLRFSSPPGATGSCSALDELPSVSHPLPVPTDLPLQTADLGLTVTDYHPTVTAFVPTVTDYCGNPLLCNALRITGSDSVCVNDADTLVFQGNKTAGCAMPIRWQLSSAADVIAGGTDSSVRVVFKEEGPVLLSATLTGKCTLLHDSLLLHAFRSPSRVDLGGDLALCKQSTVELHAGGGFKSYLWQNGATDSTFTAWEPGLYYVVARDYCDNADGDTITISVAPDVPFDLGPDTAVCRGDTVRLNAPAGFAGYSWSPNYALVGADLRTVSVYPMRDTVYLCTADKGRGCRVLDSVRVRVMDRPEHFLDAAPPLCMGNEVRLRPGGTWMSYKWFDNSSGPQVMVSAPGIYSLEVIGGNGCPGRDSVTVTPGFCSFGVYFPNAFSPDGNGQNDVFRAVVTAPLDDFYMAVFNRNGEKVFETRDAALGWDGRIRGRMAPAGGYVWYAQYRISGSMSPVVTIKGVLMLIR
jgi:gliding motility-associated-like protein